MKKLFLGLFVMLFLLFVFACESPPRTPPDDQVETYTVFFDSQGGSSVDVIEVDDGQTITPPSPTKTGHTFVGWFLGPETSADAFDADVAITSNLILYARWQVNEYTITFVVDGGTTIDSVNLDYDAPLDLPVTTKTGYEFVGWFTDVSLTQALTYTHMPAGHLTLYAKWALMDVTTYQIEYRILQPTETVIQISLGNDFAAALTSIGRVFTWGANFYGVLGDGSTELRSIPVEIRDKFGLQEEEIIIQIELGWRHSAALTSLGRVFTWGNNQHGQLGNGSSDFSASDRTPTDITANFDLRDEEKIIHLAVGSEYSVVLTSQGRVFTWGANWYGSLGDGTADLDANPDPRDITGNFLLHDEEMIIHVTLGTYHLAALTSLGRVFTWGVNWYGALGDGTANWDANPDPRDITGNFLLHDEETIVQLSMGHEHSAALTSMGRIFTWGGNWFGQLGNGTADSDDHPYPLDVTSHLGLAENETVIQISLGGYHSAVVTSMGRVFTWGNNQHGQLGNGTSSGEDPNPNPIDITSGFGLPSDETISQVILGHYMSFALTDGSRYFSWGKNNFGQLLDGTTDSQPFPDERIIPYVGLPTFFTVRTDEFPHMSDIVPFVPEKDGYVFSGWYTDVTFTTLYEFGPMPGRNIKRYGYWIPVDSSLVANGDFSQPFEDAWELWFGDGGISTATIVDGVLVFDITNIGNNWWSNHFYQTGLTLTQGVTLSLTFEARADLARTIVVKLEDANFHGYIDENVDITTEWATYTFDFYMSMPTRTDGKLIFAAGNMWDRGAATGVVATIYIDNVRLVIIDPED